MISISLCMIVKNEEDTIVRCLESIKDIVDEINIIDTGSTDQTKEVLKKYTNRIYDFEWVHDFAKARNYAFQQATKDYILWLDADDVFLPEDQKKLKELKGSLDLTTDSVTMDYNLSTDQHGNVLTRLKRNRLVKRTNQFQWIGAVHEYLEVYGAIVHSDVAVTHHSVRHDTNRNLLIYEKQLANRVEFSPRDLFYFANELKDHQMYLRAIEFYERFLLTEKGWIEDNISACGRLADCFLELGDYKKELESNLRSFQYDHPRPEFCCRLGFYFLKKKELHAAIFWYTLATEITLSSQNLGLQSPQFSTWLPHLQLCVCFDQLGQHKIAYEHNEKARQYRPDDSRILQNKEYLESVLIEGLEQNE
ncbi:glycosyltransferase family 2 protein [Sporosarcina sp. BI001-red]|uniref:glycosyltransferase family 2 protein n=1 Tax=Sporosarcina sp. BI001-red TaxID=2282866 RepID=UPI000E27C886|nr:glycosyltransferase family 2 protein [Sporosarcina sp. BI001-red]REB05493.1 glycosyltransferase family 2 protein [Sporosarcina sp. BI001-red]